jgi:hypothetical protein
VIAKLIVHASCAVGYPDCQDTGASDGLDGIWIPVVIIAVVIVVLIAVRSRRGR